MTATVFEWTMTAAMNFYSGYIRCVCPLSTSGEKLKTVIWTKGHIRPALSSVPRLVDAVRVILQAKPSPSEFSCSCLWKILLTELSHSGRGDGKSHGTLTCLCNQSSEPVFCNSMLTAQVSGALGGGWAGKAGDRGFICTAE